MVHLLMLGLMENKRKERKWERNPLFVLKENLEEKVEKVKEIKYRILFLSPN